MVLSGTGTFRPVSPVVFVQVSQGSAIARRSSAPCALRAGRATDLDFPYHPHVTSPITSAEDALDAAFDELADFRCRFLGDLG
jgi:2'-5' RNA ligase